jgi:hypothetical protein
MGKSKHDNLVDRLAQALGREHQRKGVDLRVKKKAIEAEVNTSGVYHAIPQLRASRKHCKYLAVSQGLRDLALQTTKGTGIGVMNGNGKIIKRCRPKR